MFKNFVDFFASMNKKGSNVAAMWLSVFNIGSERKGFRGCSLIPTDHKHFGSPVFVLVRNDNGWTPPPNTIKNPKIAKNIDENYQKWYQKNKTRLEKLNNG